MMPSPAWLFPDDRRFQVTDQSGTWSDCTLVSEDEDTVTIDFSQEMAADSSVRVQIRREDIRAVSFPLTSYERLESAPGIAAPGS